MVVQGMINGSNFENYIPLSTKVSNLQAGVGFVCLIWVLCHTNTVYVIWHIPALLVEEDLYFRHKRAPE
jgi:hypothetical protein